MKKALLTLVLVTACTLGASAQPQGSNVRVGPAADDAGNGANGSARKDEKKKDAEKKSEPSRAEKNEADPPAVSSNASNAPAPNRSATTTDAPAKSNNPVVPVVPPKSTLSVDTTTNPAPAGDGIPAPATDKSPSGAEAANTPTSNWTPPPAPAPTSIYRVGIGDVLDIRLLNTDTRESTLYTVMPGGMLDYPLAGDPVNVAGMTTDEVGVRLAAELRRRAVFDRPQLFVTVREYASHTVLVSGLVHDPGVKILRREAVPLYVIIAEAQPKPEAGRAIVMSHATGQSTMVELSNPQSLNMLIHTSDVVNVVARPQEFFYIGGEVSAPGQKDFHSGMTLTQAVLASGGATRNASGAVNVSRPNAEGRLVSARHDLKRILQGAVPDPVLQPGDRIEVERKK